MDSPAKPKASPVPVPNLNNLERLSESSTGDWERGRPAHNARSPTQPSVLDAHMRGMNLNKTPTAPSASQTSPASTARPGAPSSIASVGSTGSASGSTRSTNLFPRQAREGYGFRPSSGASTPVVLRSPPVEAQASDEAEVESEPVESEPVTTELDSQFNADVKRALQQPASLAVGANALIPEGGIADAEGLGWPGKFALTCLLLLPQYFANHNQQSAHTSASTRRHRRRPPTWKSWPARSAPSSSASARTQTARVFSAHQSATPRHSCG